MEQVKVGDRLCAICSRTNNDFFTITSIEGGKAYVSLRGYADTQKDDCQLLADFSDLRLDYEKNKALYVPITCIRQNIQQNIELVVKS